MHFQRTLGYTPPWDQIQHLILVAIFRWIRIIITILSRRRFGLVMATIDLASLQLLPTSLSRLDMKSRIISLYNSLRTSKYEAASLLALERYSVMLPLFFSLLGVYDELPCTLPAFVNPTAPFLIVNAEGKNIPVDFDVEEYRLRLSVLLYKFGLMKQVENVEKSFIEGTVATLNFFSWEETVEEPSQALFLSRLTSRAEALGRRRRRRLGFWVSRLGGFGFQGFGVLGREIEERRRSVGGSDTAQEGRGRRRR
uniref:Uncharacterized protein n=1 Tax=Cannabis sativa TaxID=3483 RepID=A0A803Q7T5_CANSA